MRKSSILRAFTALDFIVYVPGLICFAAFCWAVKWHFRRTERIPPGTYLISGLTLAGFSWFTWRVISDPCPVTWEAAPALFVFSICLFIWTIVTTRKTRPTMAFDTDEPSFLLSHGPYKYVRHPFYLSYLLFWAGTAFASPGLVPWSAPAVMLLVYWNAAWREEGKFAHSKLSAAYDRYRANTGMFLPSLRSVSRP